MKTCTECGGPVTAREAERNGFDTVQHRNAPSGCPPPVEDSPHKGKRHDAVQRQLEAADLLTSIRVGTNNVKQLIEKARFGTQDTMNVIWEMQQKLDRLRTLAQEGWDVRLEREAHRG